MAWGCQTEPAMQLLLTQEQLRERESEREREMWEAMKGKVFLVCVCKQSWTPAQIQTGIPPQPKSVKCWKPFLHGALSNSMNLCMYTSSVFMCQDLHHHPKLGPELGLWNTSCREKPTQFLGVFLIILGTREHTLTSKLPCSFAASCNLDVYNFVSSKSGHIYIFGGYDAEGNFLNDLWVLRVWKSQGPLKLCTETSMRFDFRDKKRNCAKKQTSCLLISATLCRAPRVAATRVLRTALIACNESHQATFIASPQSWNCNWGRCQLHSIRTSMAAKLEGISKGSN